MACVRAAGSLSGNKVENMRLLPAGSLLIDGVAIVSFTGAFHAAF